MQKGNSFHKSVLLLEQGPKCAFSITKTINTQLEGQYSLADFLKEYFQRLIKWRHFTLYIVY